MSIDTLYTAFTTLATTFLGSKSAFDTLASSYDSVKNTYNSQLKSADLNADNFTENTAKSTALQLENQKASLELAQKSLATQIDSSDNNEAIQLMSLKNQILTLKQNISVLSNSLDGETLYAGVDGIIKTRMVGEDNKVVPSTPLCQIAPKDELNMSIQVFSYQKLNL
jgi:multidrug resistance efflux pump